MSEQNTPAPIDPEGTAPSGEIDDLPWTPETERDFEKLTDQGFNNLEARVRIFGSSAVAHEGAVVTTEEEPAEAPRQPQSTGSKKTPGKKPGRNKDGSIDRRTLGWRGRNIADHDPPDYWPYKKD